MRVAKMRLSDRKSDCNMNFAAAHSPKIDIDFLLIVFIRDNADAPDEKWIHGSETVIFNQAEQIKKKKTK